MANAAYLEDAYLTTLATQILEVGVSGGRPFAVLADTVLYPEGGGQPADRGLLNGVAVEDAQQVDGHVRHFLASPVDIGPADVELDWRRRFDHMQQHTAQHLLSAVAADHFGWATSSFHLGADQSDIELDTEAISGSELTKLEELVLREVRAARPVTVRRVSLDEYEQLGVRTRGLPEGHHGDVRLVEIEGIDITTCGGTHLRSTAEIETIRLGPTEPMRGGTRLDWIAGGRVRRRLEQLESRNAELRQLFETSGEELVEIATLKLASLKESSRQLRQRLGELATFHGRALAAADESVASAHFEGADGGYLQSIARALLEANPKAIALLTASNDKGSFFLVAAGADSSLDLQKVGPQIAEALDGRGGGGATTYQGKATCLDNLDQAKRKLRQLAS